MVDELVLALSAVVLGLYLLIRGGDWTIQAAVDIAVKQGLSKLFIGATIIAFGTSVPELFASVNANLSGFPGLSLGNIVGSNIANILLITGATAVIFIIVGQPRRLLRDVVMATAATGALAYLIIVEGAIERWHALLMLVILISYVLLQYSTDGGYTSGSGIEEVEHTPLIMHPALMLLLGLVGLAGGSELLIQGSVKAAELLGVSEIIIGLTLVALGTSLPEMATCVVAAWKRHTDLVLGNILGSNLLNVLLIAAVTVLFKPISAIDQASLALSSWIMLGLMGIFGLWLLISGKIGRLLGILMLIGYATFIGWQCAIAVSG